MKDFSRMSFDKSAICRKKQKKITKERLKNIGLYYLQRFETSVYNLREVLLKRVKKYAFENEDFKIEQALIWIDELLDEFQKLGYVNDARYAECKIKDYLAAGKSARFIKIKLQQKGIDADVAQNLLDTQNYDDKSNALKFARKKHIGPYRTNDQERKNCRQKDMACLLRAGFDYDDVCDVLNRKGEEE
ncbi:MAG: regulatory protein RecX [Alphaproteobacteria bacterium]|nr:regulatory protein RecX [Alphaproteobacteria bacterium]